MARHRLSKAALLDYALEGALTTRGLYSGELSYEDEELLHRDIAEIERRIKLVNLADERKRNDQVRNPG